MTHEEQLQYWIDEALGARLALCLAQDEIDELKARVKDLEAQWHDAATCDADLDYIEENRKLKAREVTVQWLAAACLKRGGWTHSADIEELAQTLQDVIDHFIADLENEYEHER